MHFVELKYIQEQAKIVLKANTVLQIGCGDGDFASYISEVASQVYAIDLPKFKQRLDKLAGTHHNVHVIVGNPLDVSPVKMTKGEAVDVLIHTLPITFFTSVKMLERELEIVKPRGKVIMGIELEGQKVEDVEKSATTFLESIGLSDLKFFKGEGRVYAMGTNRFKQKTLDVVVLS